MVNENRLVQRFIQLVQIDSVSGEERELAEFLKTEFALRGLTAVEDQAGLVLGLQAGNLLVKIPGNKNKPGLLFAAHMDTVEPGRGVKAIKEDDVIRSSGDTILGSDDKAAIAILLEACDVLIGSNIDHPPIEMLFTIAEEQGLLGIKQFDFGRIEARMGYVLDAGGPPGTIVIQAPCQNEIEYIVQGKSAHAGMNPEDGINAIQLAALAVSKMPCGRLDTSTTCNLGLIEGGIARNIVPDWCSIKGEVRSYQRNRLDELTILLKETFISEVEARGGKAQVDIKFLYPEIMLDRQSEVVQLAVKAAERIGIKPSLAGAGGGSDANIINHRGIPCANLGIGMKDVHTCNENINITDLIKATELVISIMETAS
jgi:tripeptide aminopeptidase